MLEKYRGAIDRIQRVEQVREYLIDQFFLVPPTRRNRLFPGSRWSLHDQLHRAGAGQADVVLALLRAGTAPALRAAEQLVGAPVGRPREKPNGQGAAKVARHPDDRRVARVEPCPYLPGTKLAARYGQFAKGRTLAQAMTRGATRRDVTRALRKGWIKLEGAGA